MPYHHSNLAAGRWQELSLAEQLGNIGSEVSQALSWRDRDRHLYDNAIDRAIELLGLTIQDSRWRHRLKEITRAREFLCDAVFGENKYRTSLEDLNRYFLSFALAARANR